MPMTACRCCTLKPCVMRRYWACTTSACVYLGNCIRRPSLGLLDFPAPIASEAITKYLVRSRGCPDPYSLVAHHGLAKLRQLPAVPWQSNTAFVMFSALSFFGSPHVT